MKVLIPGRHDPAWRATVTCGQCAGDGCGAVLEINRDDLFAEEVLVDDETKVEMALCYCASCQLPIRIGIASAFRSLPNRRAWEKAHPDQVPGFIGLA